MPPTTERNSSQPSRLRRFLLLEMPGWAILAVSVSYSIAATGGAVVFFQVLLLSAALAWLFGGRTSNLLLASLLFGWAAGTLAMFNLLVLASIGLYLLPVTAYVLVVLVLLQLATGLRPRLTVVAGFAVAVAAQLAVLGIVHRAT